MKNVLIILVLLLATMTISAQGQRGVEEAKGFFPGVKAPLFNALDADSYSFSLEDALKEGPVVLVHYRGHWCPYCNRHLEVLQDSLEYIAEAYDVDFTPTSKQLFTYNAMLSADLKKSQSNDSQRLPVPATYVISSEGMIIWRKFNPDYHIRSVVKNIPEALAQ